MSKTLFTAAALSLLLATSGMAMAHHKEGHSGGPSADRSEKNGDEKVCAVTSSGELLSPGRWAKAEFGLSLGQAARAFSHEFGTKVKPRDLMNAGCTKGSDDTDEVM